LVVRAREGRDVLPEALRERGAEVDVVVLYETVAEPVDASVVSGVDYVTFTSASTVRFFLEAVGGLDGPRVVSIGPATTAALREAGLEPDVEADPHTPDGLVAALIDDAR
jgi:uroporphyrinogen III methyltransferase / synthase